MPTIRETLEGYGKLLARVDRWYSGCLDRYPEHITCRSGCSDCCRGLFDITLLDAWHLRAGFKQLSAPVRKEAVRKAKRRTESLAVFWPELAPPYLLNHRPDEQWEELMPDEDDTPCPLVGKDGRCLAYDHRPMTCRLHGLPLVDLDGEIFHDEWCTRNFVGSAPLEIEALRGEFRNLFRDELTLFREFAVELLGVPLSELDTFIPLALMVDYERFDWRAWWRQASAEIKRGD